MNLKRNFVYNVKLINKADISANSVIKTIAIFASNQNLLVKSALIIIN